MKPRAIFVRDGDVRIAWFIVILAAALVPLVAPSHASGAAQTILLLVAAFGLNASAGYAGQPSLGQGAFVGVGAYAVALLRTRAGMDPVTSTLVAVAGTAIAGVVVARAVARLRPAFVALVTWLVAWIFAFAVSAFASVSGGANGIVIGPAVLKMRALGVTATVGATAWYEIALALAVACLAGTAVLARRYGPAASAVRDDPSIARAIGIEVSRFRFGALVLSAAVGGAAGALIVQAAGVADPTAYGPLLSVKLFVVVLLGGAATVIGPVVGLATLGIVAGLSSALAALAGRSSTTVEPVATGLVLVAVLVVAGRGVVPIVEDRLVSLRRRGTKARMVTLHGRPGASIDAESLVVRFDGVHALDGASLRVGAGTCHAVIGPNGSGKTTLLRALAGAAPTDGHIAVDGRRLDGAMVAERIRAGVARTFQHRAEATQATVRDYVLGGMEFARPAGAARVLLRTRAARDEEATARSVADAHLRRVGLDGRGDVPMRGLDAGDERLADIARALAARPRVLLLDEPAAGTGRVGAARIDELVRSLRDEGMTVVLVEHNTRLVSALADRVTVLDAGRVIAEGTAHEIARDPAVRAAYLGEPKRRPARRRSIR